VRTFALLAVVALLAARLPAQSDPRLLGAVQLYQAGRQDSARAVVRQLLQALPPTDSVYPQALYTAGLLAADPQTVQTNLQRVVIEYGQSPWADDALLRLAPTDVVRLNRTVALSNGVGPAAALTEVDRLEPALRGYHLFHATRAELLRRLGRGEEARAADARALALTRNPAERRLLTERLA